MPWAQAMYTVVRKPWAQADVRMPWAPGCVGAADAQERRMHRSGSFRRGEQPDFFGNCPPPPFTSRRSILLAHLRLEVVFETDSLNQIELRFEPVYVLFLGFENALEDLA
jgi:hypothetical protein